MFKAIAYHSNLYFDVFQKHIEEIKEKGFDTVLFAISQTDLKFNLEVFREFRNYAISQGLETWCVFWGFGGIGEAMISESSVEVLDEWIAGMMDIGFEDVFIDEPKHKKYMEWYFAYAGTLTFHVCFCDETFNHMSDKKIHELPVRSVGVSCYHLGHKSWIKVVMRTIAIAQRLYKLRKDSGFIFIQGFHIPEGMEELPDVVKKLSEMCCITNFGFWSYQGTVTGSVRSVNRKQIWDNLKW